MFVHPSLPRRERDTFGAAEFFAEWPSRSVAASAFEAEDAGSSALEKALPKSI
jgi:hypothetical protein